jgi:hypothetical protein
LFILAVGVYHGQERAEGVEDITTLDVLLLSRLLEVCSWLCLEVTAIDIGPLDILEEF